MFPHWSELMIQSQSYSIYDTMLAEKKKLSHAYMKNWLAGKLRRANQTFFFQKESVHQDWIL